MIFEPQNKDYSLSPYTGLTRESWIEAAIYLLKGIFQNINSFDNPIIMPRKETEITYPHLHAPENIQEAERKAEVFEGLTRSFFIAAPIIKENPELKICGFNLRDYYKNQIIKICTKEEKFYIGTYEELQNLTNWKDPFRPFQQTVETCALVICLWITKNQIWDSYNKEEKNTIASLLSSYAHANTVPQNWRLFNMLDLAFLDMEGYPIDEEIMKDHAQAILNYYAGDGWYRDGHSFDYYSCWAFNVYAPLWNKWYGYKKMPLLAKKFEKNSNELMQSYFSFFDKDGFTNMWGRSNIYRNAATSAFDGNLFLENPNINYGWARRICSGSLVQFLGREDFLYEGIPTLGFYGQFSPLVQSYSCAESPFWLGKAFLCLHLDKNHPFWSEKENNGIWENLKPREVFETCLNGPALCFSNHECNGETILRTGKVLKNKNDKHGMWNYSKLCFNTKFPWEASPITKEIPQGEVESQQYVLKDLHYNTISLANVTFWHGLKNKVLYRRQFFDYSLENEYHWIQGLNLADFTVPYGIIRVDKHRLFRRPVKFTLGSYGFPDNGTEIIIKEKSNSKAIILKGKDFTGKNKQMAMTIYDGWNDLKIIHSVGSNPDSEKSIIIYAETEFTKQYGGNESYVMISQIITKDSLEDFSDDDLFPIETISYEDEEKTGSYGKITINLKSGETREIDFEEIEANLQI